MLLTGIGMLCSRLDVDAAVEAELNRWYDAEHMKERVGITGFLNARRYVAISGKPKYVNFYETESLAVLDGTEYLTLLNNQTDWSVRMIGEFKNFQRTVGSVTVSAGYGYGACVGLVEIKPRDGEDDVTRRWISEQVSELVNMDGVLSAHLLENDPERSFTPPGVGNAQAGTGLPDSWQIIVEGFDANTVARICETAFSPEILDMQAAAARVSSGLYRLYGAFGKRQNAG